MIPPDPVSRPSEMAVSVKGDKCFGGKLWNVLEGDSMTWTLQDSGSKLEITVCKADVGLVWQVWSLTRYLIFLRWHSGS